MPLDELADSLIGARFATATRGYAPDEVDELLARSATALRMARDASALAAVADELDAARFTPVPGGYDPLAVRGALTRVATAVRESMKAHDATSPAAPAPPPAAREGGTPVELVGVDAELERLAAFEHELADRLARIAPAPRSTGAHPDAAEMASELARLHEEIRVAGSALRELVRQVADLRKRARDEIAREMAELRERWLGDLAEEVADRLKAVEADGDRGRHLDG